MGFVPENQVRSRLPAGGKWIRTFGPSQGMSQIRTVGAERDIGRRKRRFLYGGTDGSNPVPSTSEPNSRVKFAIAGRVRQRCGRRSTPSREGPAVRIRLPPPVSLSPMNCGAGIATETGVATTRPAELTHVLPQGLAPHPPLWIVRQRQSRRQPRTGARVARRAVPPETGRDLRDRSRRRTPRDAASVSLLRWPHDHHRDLRAGLPAQPPPGGSGGKPSRRKQAELRRPLRRPYRSQATQLGTRDTRPHCNRGTEGSAEELRAEAGRSMDTVAQKPYCKLDVCATLQANMEPSL